MLRRPTKVVLIVTVGVVIALLVPTTWWLTHRVTDTGTASAESLTASTSASTPSTPSPSAPTAPSVPTRDASIGAQQTVAPVEPTKVTIPTLSISAPVEPVGVQTDQQMQIPEDISRVGWYRYGAAPGSPTGSAVLAGHVDDKEQGIGVFGSIGTLAPGDQVDVTLADGRTLTYQVLSREIFDKSSVPWDRVFDRTGPPRIVLVTCGGSFNASESSYVDNILVTAVPVA